MHRNLSKCSLFFFLLLSFNAFGLFWPSKWAVLWIICCRETLSCISPRKGDYFPCCEWGKDMVLLQYLTDWRLWASSMSSVCLLGSTQHRMLCFNPLGSMSVSDTTAFHAAGKQKPQAVNSILFPCGARVGAGWGHKGVQIKLLPTGETHSLLPADSLDKDSQSSWPLELKTSVRGAPARLWLWVFTPWTSVSSLPSVSCRLPSGFPYLWMSSPSRAEPFERSRRSI